MRTLLKDTNAYQMLNNGVKHHAYLIVFNDAKSLRPALKEFAKLFWNGNGRISKLIDEESFADCVFLPEADKKFAVSDAETIQEESNLKPVEGDKKLFVIGDISEATVQAQNKLLKLLEEPPEGVFFLLGATTVFPVLQTVLSRVEKLEIQAFAPDKIEEYLLRNLGVQNAKLYAEASGGYPGKATDMAQGLFNELSSSAYSLALAEPYEMPQTVKNLAETKYKKELLGMLSYIFRDALFIKTGRNENELLFPTEKVRSQKLASKYSLSTLINSQSAIIKAEKDLKFNGVFSQTLEILYSELNK